MSMSPTRPDGRSDDEIRPTTITIGVNRYAEGSAMIQSGDTQIICTASVEDRVPPFLSGSGKGWVTAEYGMLPRATGTRSTREVSRGRPSGRTSEIQRLIGRALRAVVDLTSFGERTLWIDCDVILADAGTRCASITGAFAALAQAFRTLKERGEILIRPPLTGQVAAVSVGLMEGGRPILDLTYQEDSSAHVDMNIVRTDDGRYIEIQGTAEANPFSRDQVDSLLTLADTGIDALLKIQRESLAGVLDGLRARAAGGQ